MVTYYIRTSCEASSYSNISITDYKIIKANIKYKQSFIMYSMQEILNQINCLEYIYGGLITVDEVEEKQLVKEIERANKKLKIKMLQQ